MRVCHVTTLHRPNDPRIYHRQCGSAAEAGHEVHLIAPQDLPRPGANGVRVHGLNLPRSVGGGVRLLRRCRHVSLALRAAAAVDADLYHLHDPELIPLGLWLKLRTSASVVFDSHENNTAYIRQKCGLPSGLRGALGAGMACLERAAARRFDAIVTADEGTAELFRTRYKARRVTAVHNFPVLDLFAQVEAEAPERRPYDLVYHGSIPRYHLETTFAVAQEVQRRNRRVRWLFFGACPEFEWAQGEIARRGLAEVFTLDPAWIEPGDVARRVATARIGFIPLPDLPKFQQNLPTKLFEFMAIGMPTVLSDLPPSRPFVGDGRCAILVPPSDHSAYADAILRVLDDSELYRRMSAAAQELAQLQFNWRIESKKLLRLYEEIENERNGRFTGRADHQR